jgi:hypothetical protein
MQSNRERDMKRLVIVGFVCAAIATVHAAPDSLSTARELYAAAAYEDALTALAQADDSGGPDVAREVGEYRTFCLYALGRTAEAESIAEGLIRKDPLMSLDARDASPRIEAMFLQVRKRLLPTLIRDTYRSARSAAAEEDPTGAASQLTRVRAMLDKAQTIGVWDESLADLRVLVEGFLDLSAASAPARAAATPKPSPLVAPPAPAPTPSPSAPNTVRVYSADDQDVVAPQRLSREALRISPTLTALLRVNRQGRVVQITIDENGIVQNAVFASGDNSDADKRLILQEARSWQYRPATRNGAPVTYRANIKLSVDGN